MICKYSLCINHGGPSKCSRRNEYTLTICAASIKFESLHIMISCLFSLQHELSVWVAFTCLWNLAPELLSTAFLQFRLPPRRSGLRRSIAASPQRNRSPTRLLQRPAWRRSRSLPTSGSIVDTQSAAPLAALVRKHLQNYKFTLRITESMIHGRCLFQCLEM